MISRQQIENKAKGRIASIGREKSALTGRKRPKNQREGRVDRWQVERVKTIEKMAYYVILC